MRRYALLAATAVIGAGVAFQGSVNLQATTPGVPQTGHSNITGTARAGSMVGYSSSPTGIVYGGDFRSVSNQGRGVLGNASSPNGVTYGGLFQSASTTGRGIAGVSTATSGFSVGGFFTTNSPDGKGVQGSSNAMTGTNFGVYGRNQSPDGFALYGEGNASLTGNLGIGTGLVRPAARIAIVEDNNLTKGSLTILNGTVPTIYSAKRYAINAKAVGTSDASGILAQASSTAVGGTSFAVYAGADGAGTNYGILADASAGTLNYCGFFRAGTLYAQSVAAGIKAFMIDHPMDPANKILMHSSVESDERKNIYDGTVTTDSRGYATVTMPTWFEALNEDFRYQLTVIDDSNSENFILTKVVQRLRYGKFKIRSSAPNITVSWQITGNRHDPTSNLMPLEVERMKKAGEKGKYYVPEAYGKDKSLGMGYMPIEKPLSAKSKAK